MALKLDSSLNLATFTTALISIALASLVWWRRLARLTLLRNRIARIHTLSEEILGLTSAEQAADLLHTRLAEIFPSCRTRLFVLDPASGELQLPNNEKSIPPAATECLHSGQLLTTPLAIYFPALAEQKAAGVLELSGLQEWRPQADETAALHHLANQTAIAIRLMDQRHLREQLARSEQLGATGVFVSSIATQLRTPLSRIIASAAQLGKESLAAEASAAMELLDRIVAVSRPEQARTQPFDLNQAVSQLAEFRARAWRLRALSVSLELAPGPLPVMAARGQLEQALLSLIVTAEQSQEESASRSIRIETRAPAGQHTGHAILAISCPPGAPVPTDASSGLAAARSILNASGCRLEFHSTPQSTCFEITLPLAASTVPAEPSGEQDAEPARPLTLLLAHPDLTALRPLVAALGERGHRAIPADSAGLALDLASHMPFDALLASRSLSDLDWPGLASACQKAGLPIALLCAHTELPPQGIPSVHLNHDEAELDRLLAQLSETA